MGKKEESVPHLGEQKDDISGEPVCSSGVAAQQRGRNGAPEGPANLGSPLGLLRNRWGHSEGLVPGNKSTEDLYHQYWAAVH